MATIVHIGIGWRHPHYRELLEGDLTNLSAAPDFLEVHSENFFGNEHGNGGAALAVLEQGRAHFPISLHGVGLALGSAIGLDDWHLDQLARLVERIEPVRISDHACFARGNIARAASSQSAPSAHAQSNELITVHGADLLPIPFNQAALDVMSANVQRVQDRLKRSIAVENLSAYITFAGCEMPEPDFLNALAQRTGCQLLVDVNNIYVNALNAQIDPIHSHRSHDATAALAECKVWLNAIHPSHVAEIHLAGHLDCGDIVIDDHGSRIQAPVWALYEHAIARFGSTPTLIEWDTDIPPLNVLLDEAAHARRLATAVLAKAVTC